MARAFALALLAVVLAACGPDGPGQAASGQSAAAGAQAPARLIKVFVFVEAKEASPTSLAQDWLKELKAAFAGRPAQFTWVETREEAEATLRIDSAIPTPGSPDHAVLAGAVLIGKTASPFRLDYTGGPTVMAGRFANYLATQVEGARAAAAKSSAPASPAAEHK